MKALTLWQPWASLIAWDEKQYETRSWFTPYRGPLAIHAAVSNDETLSLIETNSFYRNCLDRHDQIPFTRLPHGVVLCIADLVDVLPTEIVRRKISQKEENFGDFSAGRFAWKFDNIRVLQEPIRARGMQQLWEWSVGIEILGNYIVNSL